MHIQYTFVHIIQRTSSSLSLFKCFEINIMVDFCCYFVCAVGLARERGRAREREWDKEQKSCTHDETHAFEPHRAKGSRYKETKRAHKKAHFRWTTAWYLSLNHFYFLYIYADCHFSTLFRLYLALVLSTMWLYFLASHILFPLHRLAWFICSSFYL